MGRLTARVLGSAAGGGFPQWNCCCDVCRLAWAGDARVRPRTQASLAVSADRKRWTLLNASPDLRAQIQSTAGLLNLRERSPFTIMGTAATLAAVAGNPMFGALATDVVRRRALSPGERFEIGNGLTAELFLVPGKVPLYLEGENPATAEETAANVGVEIIDGKARLAYVPGAAAMTAALRER